MSDARENLALGLAVELATNDAELDDAVENYWLNRARRLIESGWRKGSDD